MKTLTGFFISGMMLLAIQAPAATGPGNANSWAAVSVAELPAKVVATIKAAPAKDREVTVVLAVTEAVSAQPAAAPAIVGSVAKSFPDMAATAAAAAARQHPKLAADIAKAAAGAAPGKAARIVVEVCRVAPANYRETVSAVAQVVPKSSREILTELASAFPELKGGIESALAGYAGKPASVTAVLDKLPNPTLLAADTGSSEVGGVALGASLTPPYISTSTSGTNVTPSTSGTVPRGGRNYARP